MHILWKYLAPHRTLVVFSLVLAAVSQLLSLVDPIIFGKIIDDYATPAALASSTNQMEGVMFWLSIAIGISLLSRITKAFQEYMTRLVVARFGMQIFNDGMRQTMRLFYQEFEDSRSGETLSILQKVKTDTERFVNSFINVLYSSFIGIGFLVWYSVTKNWMLVPVFLVGMVVLGSLTGLLSRKIKTIQRSINKETYKMAAVMTESLRNIELVKSLGLTFSEIRRMKEQTRKIFELEMLKFRKVRTLSFLQGTTLMVLRQSILFILLWLIFRRALSTGELIAMQFISSSIFGPLQDLGNIILQYREVESSVQAFAVLMNKPIERTPENSVELGPLMHLSFDHVVFRHKSATYHAVDGISFQVKAGETIAFVGPSGSGKSTLVKLLVGLYQPISGKIEFNGIPSTTLSLNPLRRQIGFVTQDTQLFAGTIKENMLFVQPEAGDDEIIEALKNAACSSLLNRSPDGIYTLLGENGLKLSGGEKQRISIARALLRDPRLLIFDEATSALDSLTEEEINQTIRSISKRKEQITLLIAHRLSTIMHADVVYVLEKGKVVEKGTHQDLLDQKGLYNAMWRQQIGERR